jgi:hypothetical protein
MNEAIQHQNTQGNGVLPYVGSSVSFADWKRAIRKEQLYYPTLKFQKIREDYLEHYWREGYTPTDACNDILTAV